MKHFLQSDQRQLETFATVATYKTKQRVLCTNLGTQFPSWDFGEVLASLEKYPFRNAKGNWKLHFLKGKSN